jgi:hypothetical protein
MVDYRNAVAADADDVLQFWATAAEDSHPLIFRRAPV